MVLFWSWLAIFICSLEEKVELYKLPCRTLILSASLIVVARPDAISFVILYPPKGKSKE